MDSSVLPTQTSATTPRDDAQVTQAKTDTAQQPGPTTGSANKEAGPSVQVASQEAKTPAVENQAGAGGDAIEMQPSVPEPKIDASVEHIVEKSVDQEKPELSEAVKQAGVTHSGPGVITDASLKVVDNKFGVKKLDVSFAEAVREEKKTSFKSSKHWLMGVYEYVWRKINPRLRKEYVKN